MTAAVVPFPASRRVDVVDSIARRALSFRPEVGENHVRRSIEIQAAVMRRRGVGEDSIEVESRALETAIRARMWHECLRPRETR